MQQPQPCDEPAPFTGPPSPGLSATCLPQPPEVGWALPGTAAWGSGVWSCLSLTWTCLWPAHLVFPQHLQGPSHYHSAQGSGPS